jgi:hypothetical protein
MKVVFDNKVAGDARFTLEEDENGLLYETSNAATRELVCSAMFVGWGIDREPRRSAWLKELADQFGDREIAQRYYNAAIDADK